MIRSETRKRLLLALLSTYLFGAGATFIGILTPDVQQFTLYIMALVAIVWLGVRWKSHWIWHHTPLDRVLLLWGIAFVVSILANPETGRRSLIGLWYMGVYIGVWYALWDALANRALTRDLLLDALMFGGVAVMAVGYWQLTYLRFDLLRGELPRPGSTLGNPNSLGTLLIVLAAIAAGRYYSVRARSARLANGGYSLAAIVLLFLTYSRGAWLGGMAAAGTFLGLLWLARRKTIKAKTGETPAAKGWGNWSKRHRFALVGGLAAASVVVVVMVIMLAQSVGAEGRSPQLRLGIYDQALHIIADRPIVGHGLFTFGRELGRLQSQPPQFPHSHAHNVVLQVMAELGLPGLLALLFSVYVIVRRLYSQWRAGATRNRPMLIGLIAALTGFGIHHWLDTTMMMPAITLLGLLTLMLAVFPTEPAPLLVRWQRRSYLAGLSGLWVVLLVAGFWSARVYADYADALTYALPEAGPADYRGAAEQMQSAVDADPNLAVYIGHQAYLYGWAAYNDDTEAVPLAIAAYQDFLELEPGFAPGWANLAALYWQDGQQQLAITTLERAQSLAWLALPLRFQLARYYETTGEVETAREWYRRALTPQTRLWPEWAATPLSREVVAAFTPSGEAALVLALTGAEIPLSAADAARLWADSGLAGDTDTRATILRLLLLLRSEENGTIDQLLQQAEERIEDEVDEAWQRLGRAEIARSYGDEFTAIWEITLARQLIEPRPDRADFIFGGNIAALQFLRAGYPRLFLPQVFYPLDDAALLYWLNQF